MCGTPRYNRESRLEEASGTLVALKCSRTPLFFVAATGDNQIMISKNGLNKLIASLQFYISHVSARFNISMH